MTDSGSGALSEPRFAPLLRASGRGRYHAAVNRRVAGVGLLLFGSGFSALVYQTVWLREFRLIFGASTAATAAVLAIFLGGLGAGSLYAGRLVDRFARPLRLYGWLELGIASWTALTPLLIRGLGGVYFGLGGSPELGIVGASVLRIVLAVVILAPATLMMGATLPAVTRAVESESDERRKRFAFVYGLNTLGAVAGALVSTFVLLETFGNRYTLWLTCLFNVFVALAALTMAMRTEEGAGVAPAGEEEASEPGVASVPFVAVSAAAVGFVFMMLELVWYRALAPVLGGTTFTFGLILGVALLGIGAGSCFFLFAPSARSSLRAFALTAAAEAFFVILPFAMGDGIAIVAAILRSLRAIGFEGLIAGWTVTTFVVVFPAAFISGIQFPILVSLLGRGRRGVGSHVGIAYASNTAGSLVGSVATGFGLLPLLSVNGAWRLAAVILASVAIVAAFLASMRRESWRGVSVAFVVAVAALALCFAPGPTALWRHTPIGAGRVETAAWDENSIREFVNFRRRSVFWERDGVESSVALSGEDGNALMVNGKSDGHARVDAGTQVMSGLLGALIHPSPKRVLVVGLGTGTTAGWLAAVPEIETVDVVEIEPAIVDAARFFRPVNHDVLRNPKANIILGDAREVLLAGGDEEFDLIISEPSNPYRAGVASLFTTDFYRNVRSRLAPNGYFMQWMQGYEVDVKTIRTIYASYLAVFPYVTTWQTQRGDLLLIGSTREIPIDVAELQRRIAREPYRSALENAWRVNDVEGVLAHYVCGTGTARKLARGAQLNTDDKTVIEFGFARTVGESGKFNLTELKVAAALRRDRTPAVISGTVDEGLIGVRRQSQVTAVSDEAYLDPTMGIELRARADVHRAYAEGLYAAAVRAWEGRDRGPSDSAEVLTFAEALAELGSDQARPFIAMLRETQPIEADVLEARLAFRQRKPGDAIAALERAFVAYRTNPWPLVTVMHRAMTLAVAIAREDASGATGRRLQQAVSEPFSVGMLNEVRRLTELELARMSDPRPCGEQAMKVLPTFEPHVPWTYDFLSLRAECYRQKSHPLAEKAAEDLARFESHATQSMLAILQGE